MPTVGEEIVRNGVRFKYLGYGRWTKVVNDTTISGDVPLPDGASTLEGQTVSQQELQNSIGELAKQLKINNLHLALMTDEIIDKSEIE